MRPRTDIDPDLVCLMAREGVKQSAIAEQLGVGQGTISNILISHGMRKRGKPQTPYVPPPAPVPADSEGRKPSRTLMRLLAILSPTYASLNDLAVDLGVSHASISSILTRAVKTPWGVKYDRDLDIAWIDAREWPRVSRMVLNWVDSQEESAACNPQSAA